MLDGDTSDVKSDIWSVGITAIQMAQGRPPHYNLHPARVISMIIHHQGGASNRAHVHVRLRALCACRLW
jgi:serine/threonine protein kinase